LRDIEEDEELRGNLNLFKAQEAAAAADAMMEDADVDDDEEDFPEIKVDDLLDEMDNLNIVSGLYLASLDHESRS
jgi:nonsense-mediated mRNA decay protein 3